ncbi:hypothetical protein PHLGIDRAFT_14835 [Phlebiopsis gigantea 11061_1 CR5-6]|uniref:F-box domain-containing protein n=1 Tax=Phlebiopsis gigantea (strain 11061_1 CR5-6) TaxID=745531 RepID=A0A0C3S4G3_PHLG1|nr:hypothetical protein PHLGIDRAFT_14835 [Phlebiopsis gigantea 11061_1 CR5-6]
MKSQLSDLPVSSPGSIVLVPKRKPTDFILEPPTIPFDTDHKGLPLPLEMHDVILEYVAASSDQRTILCCILICRRWYKLYHPALYRVVRIKNAVQLALFTRTINFRRELGLHVEELYECPDSPHATWGFTIAVRLSKLLPNLRAAYSLNANSGYFSTPPNFSWRSATVFGEFAKLSTFCLENYRFDSFSELQRLVNSSASLSTLQCKHVTCGQIDKAEHTMPIPRRGCLKHVHIVSCNFTSAALWFWAAPTRPPSGDSTIMTFGGIHPPDVQIMQNLCHIPTSYHTDIGRKRNNSCINMQVDYDFMETPDPTRWHLRMITRVDGEHVAVLSFEIRHALKLGLVVYEVTFHNTSFAALSHVYDRETVDGLLVHFRRLNKVLIDTSEFALKPRDKQAQDEWIAEYPFRLKERIISTQGVYAGLWNNFPQLESPFHARIEDVDIDTTGAKCSQISSRRHHPVNQSLNKQVMNTFLPTSPKAYNSYVPRVFPPNKAKTCKSQQIAYDAEVSSQIDAKELDDSLDTLSRSYIQRLAHTIVNI